MALLYNKTKCTQLLDQVNYAIPTAIEPGMVFDPSPYKILIHDFFSEFDISKLKGAQRIVGIRQYALGDLIQLVPVMRRLRTDYNVKSVGILTTERYMKDIMRSYPDIEIYVSGMERHCNATFLFGMDGILEKDHSLSNNEKHQHRVHIYCDFFGLENNKNFDWSSKIQNLDVNLNSNMKKIGLQIRGSGAIKTLPFDFVKRIANELSEKYQVILLDSSKDFGFEGKNILNLCGKMKVQECISLLSMIDGVITMDSGMLWMAHSAKCPVVTFLGSTREEERMTLHPLYPEKARTINLAKMVGCEPCFETRVRCKGKHNCMTAFNRDDVMRVLKVEIQKILGE